MLLSRNFYLVHLLAVSGVTGIHSRPVLYKLQSSSAVHYALTEPLDLCSAFLPTSPECLIFFLLLICPRYRLPTTTFFPLFFPLIHQFLLHLSL